MRISSWPRFPDIWQTTGSPETPEFSIPRRHPRQRMTFARNPLSARVRSIRVLYACFTWCLQTPGPGMNEAHRSGLGVNRPADAAHAVSPPAPSNGVGKPHLGESPVDFLRSFSRTASLVDPRARKPPSGFRAGRPIEVGRRMPQSPAAGFWARPNPCSTNWHTFSSRRDIAQQVGDSFTGRVWLRWGSLRAHLAGKYMVSWYTPGCATNVASETFLERGKQGFFRSRAQAKTPP